MLKRTISYLVVFSILYSNMASIAHAMDTEGPPSPRIQRHAPLPIIESDISTPPPSSPKQSKEQDGIDQLNGPVSLPQEIREDATENDPSPPISQSESPKSSSRNTDSGSSSSTSSPQKSPRNEAEEEKIVIPATKMEPQNQPSKPLLEIREPKTQELPLPPQQAVPLIEETVQASTEQKGVTLVNDMGPIQKQNVVQEQNIKEQNLYIAPSEVPSPENSPVQAESTPELSVKSEGVKEVETPVSNVPNEHLKQPKPAVPIDAPKNEEVAKDAPQIEEQKEVTNATEASVQEQHVTNQNPETTPTTVSTEDGAVQPENGPELPAQLGEPAPPTQVVSESASTQTSPMHEPSTSQEVTTNGEVSDSHSAPNAVKDPEQSGMEKHSENLGESAAEESKRAQEDEHLLVQTDEDSNAAKDYDAIPVNEQASEKQEKVKQEPEHSSPSTESSEKTPLIVKKAPASKPSYASQAWNFLTGLFKKKDATQEYSYTAQAGVSSAPLLLSNDNPVASDSSDAEDGANDVSHETPSDLGETSLKMDDHSINGQPGKHRSEREMDYYDPEDKEWVIMGMDKEGKTGGKKKSKRLNVNSAGDNGDAPEKGETSPLIAQNETKLDPATRAFLLHVKKRVIDGKLNGIQIAGIVGGVVVGGAVSPPLIAIFNDGIFELNDKLNGQLHGHTPLNDAITGILGPTLGIDAAARTATILVHFCEPETNSFSIKKDKAHRYTIALTRGGIYTGALIAGSLPLYYLYSYLYLCNEGDTNCDPSTPAEDWVGGVFASFGPFLVFDTTLQYGYQLSQQAERTINKRFSRIRNLFSPIEQKRQAYLNYLKHLKKIIYYSDVDTLYDLYENIFVNTGATTSANQKIAPEEIKIKETLRVLRNFQSFYEQATKPFEAVKKGAVTAKQNKLEDEEARKQINASRWGWVVAASSTMGRTVVFCHIVEAMLHAVGVHGALNQGITVVAGGLISNFIQGKIEKDAARQAAYEIGKGEKIPVHGSSHPSLRVGIKTWDYVYGAFNTLPYLLVGINATQTWELGWRIVTLAPFGLADTFNNAKAFDDSNFAVINAVDSAASYCYPSEGYKKDKLVRMTRQLRKIFKNLEPQVLETLSSKL